MNWTILLALLIGVFYPLYFLLTYKKTNDKILRNEALKLSDYKQTIIIFWSLTVLIVANFLFFQDPNLNFRATFNPYGIGVLVLILIFAIIQFRTANVTQDTFSVIKEKMKHLYHYLPKTNIELKWFIALSISAGICEEIIFRLFLFEFLNINIGF